VDPPAKNARTGYLPKLRAILPSLGQARSRGPSPYSDDDRGDAVSAPESNLSRNFGELKERLLESVHDPLARRLIASWPKRMTRPEVQARVVALLEVLVAEVRVMKPTSSGPAQNTPAPSTTRLHVPPSGSNTHRGHEVPARSDG
jgi:hypothetical protein